MKLKIEKTPEFVKNMVAKALSNLIYKKCGYKVEIHFDDLDVSMVDGETEVTTTLKLNLEREEFSKIVKSIGL